jgi:hypothetical protein
VQTTGPVLPEKGACVPVVRRVDPVHALDSRSGVPLVTRVEARPRRDLLQEPKVAVEHGLRVDNPLQDLPDEKGNGNTKGNGDSVRGATCLLRFRWNGARHS